MPSETHYDVLGVSNDASEQDIRYAYRSLIRKHHPDIAGDHGEAMTQKINHAYDILSDPANRRSYDFEIRPQPATGASQTSTPTWDSAAQAAASSSAPHASTATEELPSYTAGQNIQDPGELTFKMKWFPAGSAPLLWLVGGFILLNVIIVCVTSVLPMLGNGTEFGTGPAALTFFSAFMLLFKKSAKFGFAFLAFSLVQGILAAIGVWDSTSQIGGVVVIVVVLLWVGVWLAGRSWKKLRADTTLHWAFENVRFYAQYGSGPFYVDAVEGNSALLDGVVEDRTYVVNLWGKAVPGTWVALNRDNLIAAWARADASSGWMRLNTRQQKKAKAGTAS